MKNIFEQIVHKLWFIDHHKNEQDIFIKNSIEKMHYFWLREHLQELKVCSSHISYENLREFAVENLLKNGYIYYYKLDPKKCLVHVRDLEISRDFVAETLQKNDFDAVLSERDAILKELENISDLRDFAAETLAKNGTDKISLPDTPSGRKRSNCDLGDFATETFSLECRISRYKPIFLRIL